MEFINLSKSYNHQLFEKFSFKTKHKITLVLGNNGVGKTTLLRMIAGTIKPTSGEIKINRSNGIGLLFGEEVGLYEKETAKTNIKYFANLNLISAQEYKTNYELLNEYLVLDEIINHKIEKCSKGQKQRIAIAKTLIHDPQIILLDEPTNGLDVYLQSRLIELINQKSTEGKKIFFSTHHYTDALAVIENVDTILYINQRKVQTISEVNEEKLAAIFAEMKAGEQK